MLHNNLYANLVNDGKIQRLSNQDDINHFINIEKESLIKLTKRKITNKNDLFLKTYDKIFRHVCLELLSNGFKITSNKPHQTFIAILSNYYDKNELLLLVSVRHQIKKNLIDYQEDNHQKYYQMMLEILNHYDNADYSKSSILPHIEN